MVSNTVLKELALLTIFVGLSFNGGGNQMFHSFAIWVTVKRLKELKLIDHYLESGVFKGFTARMVRRYLCMLFDIYPFIRV